ncbi:peptide-methionine (S)-S-oxide reductase MsrA, partial [Pseudomonas aeruginosa]
GEDGADGGGFLDAGDDPYRAAAVGAGGDVDGKDPLEPLRPAHRTALLLGAARLVVGADVHWRRIARRPLAAPRGRQLRTQVCRTGKTGHAEAVRVEYNEDEISLNDILHYFFKIHDPTTKNRQGNDVGTSYRSAVFYRDDAQKAIIETVIDEVNEIGRFENPVVTAVALEKEFYDAEEYHQNYLKKNPHGYTCHFERD